MSPEKAELLGLRSTARYRGREEGFAGQGRRSSSCNKGPMWAAGPDGSSREENSLSRFHLLQVQPSFEGKAHRLLSHRSGKSRQQICLLLYFQTLRGGV